MIFINEMKDMRIYNKPFFAPINVDNKKKEALAYLLTPNIESSKKIMLNPLMINRLYYQSYYLEKNVNYFINSSTLESADNKGEYFRETSSQYFDYLDYIEEGNFSKATMYFRIKGKQNLQEIVKKHSYYGLLNLVKKTKKIEDLLYLRTDYYQGMNTFKKLRDNIDKCERLGYCRETKNIYKGIYKKYIDKGITAKDVDLTIEWYQTVYYPTLKEQISSLRESVNEAVKSDINNNYISKEKINLNSLKKVKINKDICKKLSSSYKYLKHIRISNNTEGYLFLNNSEELVCLISVETKENGQVWIQALEVDSKYKGHKLGAQLLDYAVNNLKANYLSVSKNNNIAFNMYNKYGFKTYKETDTMYFMTLDSTVKESTLSTGDRKELPDSDFGLPDKRKYPIHDEDHLKSAIKFFNYVDKSDEEELANNIIKRAKKLNIDISAGKNNRLKKYLSEETIDTLELNFSTCFDAYKLSEIEIEDLNELSEEDFYPTLDEAIKSLEDRHSDKKYFVYTYTNKGAIYVGSINVSFLDTERFESNWSDMVGTLDRDDFTGEYTLNEDSKILDVYKKSLIGKKVYHGGINKYNTLQPTSLFLGNKFEDPDWCLYTYKDKERARGWAVYSCIRNIFVKCGKDFDIVSKHSEFAGLRRSDYEWLEENINNIPIDLKKYYVYEIEIDDDSVIGLGHSSNTKNCITLKNYNIVPVSVIEYVIDINDIKKNCDIVDDDKFDDYVRKFNTIGINSRGFISLFMNNDNILYKLINRKDMKFILQSIENGDLKPGDNIEDFLDQYNIITKIDFRARLLSFLSKDVPSFRNRINKYHLNEASDSDPFITYSGYKDDIERFRELYGKDNETKAKNKYHFIIKDDLESCRMWFLDDILNIELPSEKVYNDYFEDGDYNEYIQYNQLYGDLIRMYPDSANTCLPCSIASYLSKKGKDFDRKTWVIEDLLDKIRINKGLHELFDILKTSDLNKLLDYAKVYGIDIGTINDLKYDTDISEVSKDRRFDLKYFTRHIMYNCRKGKHKAHKVELNIKHNLDDNKPNNTVTTAPVVADIDNKNVEATPDSGAGGDTESTSESFTKYVLDTIDESMYIKSDNMVIFTEDSSQDMYLRKILFNDRLKQNKDVILKYKQLKEELDFIKYTFTDINRYDKKNLFVDLSYYNEIFFRNNQFKLDKGINLYAELLRRLLNTPRFNDYKLKTVFIPIDDWDVDPSTKMWFYRDNINPISLIYRIMETTPSKLKDIFKDMDILFICRNRYFKLNFSHEYDYNTLKTKFKLFINNLKTGVDVSEEDKDDTGNGTESKQAIVTNIIDKLDSAGVKLDKHSLTGNNVDTSDSEKIITNKDTDEKIVNKKKEELLKTIDTVADKSINTDDAIDKMEDENIKKLIVDLATQEEDSVKINNARASRMLKLQNDMLDIKLNNVSVRDLLNAEPEEELPKTSIPVSINKEQWTDLKFTNFDSEYDINEDIVKMINKLSTVSRPLAIRNISVEDNSTSEDFVDLYTIDLEDYRGKRYSVKFDVPKFKSNSDYLIVRGNKKTIQNQFFNMPILKTDEDTCQIISNYNKIFVRRFGTVAGRSIPDAGKIIKAINKYKGTQTKIQFGNNVAICKKYELPIDYIDIAQVANKIENKQYIIYFNQDEIRELYGDKIDNTVGLPFGYKKENKEILYYYGSTHIPFSSYIVPYLTIDTEFNELYNAAARSVKYTYSKCSILTTEIPLIIVCAYSEGLSQVLKKANIQYTIKEKLEKSDRQSIYNHIKFADGYLVYEIDYNSSLLLNGLKDCDTESYPLEKIDSKSMYVDFLDNFGGRIKADGLENFYDCMIDPITKEVLEHYKLPTDYVEVLLHANLLLADNKFIKHTDTSSRRLRKQELIAVKVYKTLFNDAYATYANQLRHNSNSAQYTVKRTAVIDKFMEDSTSSDLSIINCLNDVETKNAVTFKGESGLNTDRAYSLDKRTYDDSMLNLLAMSTGFSANVGITRQATVDMNIDGKRGYIKSINNNTDKLSSSKTLSITEAVNPFGTTRDDPFRTAMTFIQTSKHAVRTAESDPLLVTNASDEAIAYLSSDIFAFKAKQDGKVLELTDDYILVEYKDGTKDYVNLAKTIEKNSDGGFYVPLKLDKADKLKEGSKFKARDILAYDKLSFSNSLGENDNIAFNVGTLTKVAVINTDEGFEDSTIITSTMSERMATDVIVCKDIILNKDTIVSNMVPVDQYVNEGDTLLIISDSSDDDTTNILMKNLIADEDEISELGRKQIKSPVTGKVAGVKIYRTIEIDEMSKSLQQLVKKYEDPINKMKKKLDSNKILSSDLPATYKLPTTGKLKNAEDSVRIEIYLEVHDILSVGDKIVMDRANKGIIKDIIPADLAPYTDFRPNEEVSVFANVSSFNKRMVISPLVIGSINKLLIELDRSIKDILDIPYDDSKV